MGKKAVIFQIKSEYEKKLYFSSFIPSLMLCLSASTPNLLTSVTLGEKGRLEGAGVGNCPLRWEESFPAKDFVMVNALGIFQTGSLPSAC